MAPKKRRIKSGKCDLDPPVLRFLVTVCFNLEKKERFDEFLKIVSKMFNIYENALSKRLCAEITNLAEFNEDVPVPGKLPAIYAPLQNYSGEADAERLKLHMIADLTRLGDETIDDILSLIYTPIVKYCPYCKYSGYNKDHYFNHNFKGGHDCEVICPAAIHLADRLS